MIANFLPPWLIAAMLAILVVGLILIRAQILSQRKSREEFLATRQPLDNDAFVRAAGCNESREACIAIREAMAGVFKLPSELLHPENTFESLFRLQPDGGDDIELVFALEDSLNVEIDDSRWNSIMGGHDWPNVTLGQFIHRILNEITRLAPSPTPNL